MGESLSSFGERVRAIRRWRGLSVREVANRGGFRSASSVTRVEKSKAEPVLSTAVGIARGLGVTLGQLVGEEPLPCRTCPKCHGKGFLGVEDG